MLTIEQAALIYVRQNDGCTVSPMYDGFEAGVQFCQRWIPVEEESIPKDGKEYLTRNDRQGGVLSLISWNKIHNHYQDKGEYVFEQNAGTHWRSLFLA